MAAEDCLSRDDCCTRKGLINILLLSIIRIIISIYTKILIKRRRSNPFLPSEIMSTTTTTTTTTTVTTTTTTEIPLDCTRDF